jgi:arylsulfatase
MKTKPGEITEQPGHLIDFMATFIDVANATYLKKVEGRQVDPLQGKSLAPIFYGSQRAPHEKLYFHFGFDRAWREGDWKLVSAKRGRWELYNLATDRTEMHDLAFKHPERVAAMEQRWLETARNVDRLSDKQLAKVRPVITKLNFRRDTSTGKAESN